MSIALNLKLLRTEKKLSQKDMSEILDMNLRTYASYERGEREPGAAVILKICQAFDVSSDVILKDNQISNKQIEENKKSTPIVNDRSAVINHIAAMPQDEYKDMVEKLRFAGFLPPSQEE